MAFFEIEYVTRKEYSTMPNRHHHDSCFELFFLIEGSLQAIFSDKLLELTAPAMMVIPPKKDHKNSSSPGKRYLIYISPDNLSPFELKSLWKMSEKAYNLSQQAISLLEEIIAVERNDEADYLDKQLILTKYLIYIMLKQLENHNGVTVFQKSDKQFFIASVISFINHNYNKRISYETISKEFSVSTSYLKKHFKSFTDKTVGEYILQVRIENAKYLLTSSNKSIDKISFETGFNNASYFSKCFKNEVGITPLQYRKHRRV